MKAFTDKVRGWMLVFFGLTVVSANVGWIAFELDPTGLAFVLAACSAGIGIGEASAHKKRQVYNGGQDAERTS